MTIKICTPGGVLKGHLIEARAYARVRDVAEALGFQVTWQEPDTVLIEEHVRSITPETDLRLPSGADPAMLDAHLADTPLQGLGRDFVALEQKWRVSAVFGCAVACHESDFGRSAIANDKRNLFGFMAYDSSPYQSARNYSTYHDSIDDFCRLISREYLNPVGAYHNGPTVSGVGKRYATDPEWGTKVLRHCQDILTKGE